MTVDAIIARSRPELGGEESLHAPVRTVRVVAVLRPVALRAEAQRIDHGQERAVREMERIVATRAGYVTVRARKFSMPECEALMELTQLGGLFGQWFGRLQGVTRSAGDTFRAALGRLYWDRRQLRRCVDRRWKRPFLR